MHNNPDLIVIGGGPAGCAAASFAARLRWKVVVIDSSLERGYLGSLGNVSFFPGFPEAISGPELVKRMRRQAELTGAHFVSESVCGISMQDGSFRVATESGRELTSRAVVIAVGAASRTNYLHNEREYMGRGVSHDALADGPGEAPPLMTEELRVGQIRRDGPAVHPQKGPSGAGRPPMDGAGHHLLAGASLAQDEHRRLGPGHELHGAHHRL